MSLFKWARRIAAKILNSCGPARCVIVVEGDSLPQVLPYRNLILAQDDGENWCVGMHCPCGCSDMIELFLVREGKPRWDLVIDDQGRPTLEPSVWRASGCRSHFWIRKGRVYWC